MSDMRALLPEIIALHLNYLHERYKAGDKNALFQAIRFCGREKVVMPGWVNEFFHRATNEWYAMRAKTLDDAFGLQWPKGKHFNAAKKRRRLELAVRGRIRHLVEAEGLPIDESLFKRVGKEFGLGKTLASEYLAGKFKSGLLEVRD